MDQAMGLIDKALEVGAMADWITPAFALVRTQVLRTHVMFAIHKEDILYAQITLKEKRIRMQDCQIIDGVCLFTVGNEHARWAADLLPRNGVPVLNAEHVAQNAPRVRKRKVKASRPRRRTKNVFASFF